ncbi:hypothetical protein HY990_01785 [Candidatus Micrarchaeota archaeon]|nr:hypothetical protein [Candidatus Micrarchaeota archaeon]
MGNKTRNVLILEARQKGTSREELAAEFGIHPERVRQIEKTAERGRRKLKNIPEEDLRLCTLGSKTRAAIDKAAGKKIKTIEEFKDWVKSFASDMPKPYELGERLKEMPAFSDPKKSAMISGVVRLCQDLDLVAPLF